MAQSDPSLLQKWESRIANPAAPAGVVESSRAAIGHETQDPRYAESNLAKWTAKGGLVNSSQSWYTGANFDGTNNGWDTTFMQTWQKNEDAKLKEGVDTFAYYRDAEKHNATGVVLYGDREEEDEDGLRFGDVFQDGQKVANLYDDFDRNTANLMTGALLKGRDMGEVFSNSEYQKQVQNLKDPEGDVIKPLDDAITEAIKEQNRQMQAGANASRLQKEVDDQDWAYGTGADAAVAGGGAVASGGFATALLAGGATVSGTGVGLPLGLALVGGAAAIGGLGAWLNRDELQPQMARAKVVIGRGYDEDMVTGTGEVLKQAGGLMQTFGQPLTNTYHGVYDVAQGEAGDRTSEIATDTQDGTIKTGALTVLNIGTMLGDSAFQFAGGFKGVGGKYFTTQMGMQVGGGTAQLATGRSFDFERAEFDNIYTDENGNFDAKSSAAGVGVVGIDVLQMAMPAAIGKAFSGATAKAGDEAIEMGRLGRMGDKLSGGRLSDWNRTRGLAPGETRIQSAGFTAIRGNDGKVVEGSMRATVSFVAPSEHFVAATAAARARRLAAREGGRAVTADDFFREAQRLSSGTRIRETVLATGFGEAYEEAVQSVLEPWSHGHAPDGLETMKAAAAGFGMGAGMSLSVTRSAGRYDRAAYALANENRRSNGEAEYTLQEWNELDTRDKEAAAMVSDLPAAQRKAGLESFMSAWSREQAASTQDMWALADAVNEARAAAEAGNLPGTDRTFIMTQRSASNATDVNGDTLPGRISDDSVEMSLGQVTEWLDSLVRTGLPQQKQFAIEQYQAQLTERVEQYQAVLDSETATAEEKTEAQTRLEQTQAEIAEYDSELALIDLQIEEGKGLLAVLRRQEANISELRRVNSKPAKAKVREIIAETNRLLAGMHDGTLPDMEPATREALQRLLTYKMGRHPFDDPGSIHGMKPQVHERLTWRGQDKTLFVSPTILKAINGDWDGDKLQRLNKLFLSKRHFAALRAGTNLLSTDGVNIDPLHAEPELMVDMAAALADSNERSHAAANEMLAAIRTRMVNRLLGAMGSARVTAGDRQLLTRQITRFMDEFEDAVRAGNPEARADLLNKIWLSRFGNLLHERGMGTYTNEWSRLQQIITGEYRVFQVKASWRKTRSVKPEEDLDTPAPTQAGSLRSRRVKAATTPGATALNVFSTTTPFRVATTTNYATDRSTRDSDAARPRGQMDEIVASYLQLSSMQMRPATEELAGKDPVVRRARAMLSEIARGQAVAGLQLPDGPAGEAIIANMEVDQIIFAGDANGLQVRSFTGQPISLAQHLLHMSVEIERTIQSPILARDESLKARLAKQDKFTSGGSLNAGRAFLELFSATEISTATDGDTGNAQGNLRVGQLYRKLATASREKRARMLHQLRDAEAYEGRDGRRSLPYLENEVVGRVADGNRVSAYHSIVDALAAASNNRIALDAKGNTIGELAVDSERASTSLRDGYAAVQKLLTGYRKRPGDSIDQMQQMLTEYPELSRTMWGQIPAKIRPLLFTRRADGSFAVHPVLLEAYTKPDAKQFEAYLWGQIVSMEQMALGRTNSTDDRDDTEDGATQYAKLPRQIHKVLYRTRRVLGEQAYRDLLTEIFEATDLEVLFRDTINGNPFYTADGAPLTPWADDAQHYDANLQAGGWGASFPVADMREAFTSFTTTAERIVGLQAEDAKLINHTADDAARSAVDHAYAQYDGKSLDSVTNENDRRALAGWQTAVAAAKRRGTMLGSQSLMRSLVGVLPMFSGNSHDKGKTQPHLRALGHWMALRNQTGLHSAMDRAVASVTTADLRDLDQNLAALAGRAMRIMTESGQQVAIDELTDEELFRLHQNPATRALADAIVFPTVIDTHIEGGPMSTQFLSNKSFDALVHGKIEGEMFAEDSGFLSQRAAMLYTSTLMAEAAGIGQDPLEVFVELAWHAGARLSTLSREATDFDLERIANEAVLDYAKQMQLNGGLLVPGSRGTVPTVEDPENPGDMITVVEDMGKQVRQQMRQRVAADAFGYVAMPGLSIDAYLNQVIKPYLKGEELDTVALGLANIDELLQNDQFEEMLEHVRMLEGAAADRAEVQDFLERLLKSDGLKMIIEQYALVDTAKLSGQELLNAEGRNAIRKTNIIGYVKTVSGVRSASGAMNDIAPEFYNLKMDGSNLAESRLTEEQWQIAAKAVIDHRISNLLVAGNPRSTANLYDNTDVMDVSFGYLTNKMFDEASASLQAAALIHQRTHALDDTTDPTEAMRHATEVMFNPKKLGRWDPRIADASLDSRDRARASSVELETPASGNTPKTMLAMIAATRRNTKILDQFDSLLSSVSLTAEQLAFSDPLANGDAGMDVQVPMDFALPDASGRRPGTLMVADLGGSMVRKVRVKILNDAGQVIEDLKILDPEDDGPTAADATFPWMKDPKVATSGYEVLSIRRLRDALEDIALQQGVPLANLQVDVDFFHHQSTPPALYNSVFFDGVVGQSVTDDMDSILAAFHLNANGENAIGQGQAIGASKTGANATKHFETPPFQTIQMYEADALTDLAGVVYRKARHIMGLPIRIVKNGKPEEMSEDMLKGLRKQLTLHHWVKGRDPETGEWTLWDYERVVQHQMTTGTAVPLLDAQLYVPSAAQLRRMLGDITALGADRGVDNVEFDPRHVDTYEGAAPSLLRRVERDLDLGAPDPTLEQTSLVNRGLQVRHRAGFFKPSTNVAALSERVRKETSEALAAITERAKIPGFDRDAINTAHAVPLRDTVHKSTIRMDLRGQGLPLSPLRGARERIDLGAIKALQAKLDLGAGVLWSHDEETNTPGTPLRGVLTKYSLATADKDAETGMTAVRGDAVILNVDSFYRVYGTEVEARKQLETRVRQYAGRGVSIALHTVEARRDAIADLAPLLDGLGLEPLGGAFNIYTPREVESRRNQYEVSRDSTLATTRVLSARNRAVIFISRKRFSMEGGAWANPETNRLRDYIRRSTLVRTMGYADFAPVETVSRQSPKTTEFVQQQVRDIAEDTEQIAKLLEPHGGKVSKKEIKELQAALNRLVARWDSGNAGLMPQVGESWQTGDIIPLVNTDTGQVYLQRYGYRDVDDPTLLFKDGMTIAVSKPKINPSVTRVEGEIAEINRREDGGHEIIVKKESDTLGARLTVLFSGVKFVVGDWPADLVKLPKQGLGLGGRLIDLVTDNVMYAKKDANELTVNNASDAIAVLGLDTVDLLAEAFGFTGENAQHQTLMLLREAKKRLPAISLQQANKYISPGFVAEDILAELNLVRMAGGALDMDWSSIFDSQDTAAKRLAYATIVYLMVPGTRVEEVTQVRGLLNATDENELSYSPAFVWSQVFEDYRTPAEGAPAGSAELNTWFFSQLNKRLNRDPKYAHYHLARTFELTTSVADSKQGHFEIQGYLSMPEITVATDNPTFTDDVPEAAIKQDASSHNNNFLYAATGGVTAFDESRLSDAKAAAIGMLDMSFDPDATTEANAKLLWRRFADLPATDTTFRSTFWENAAQRMYSDESIATFNLTRRALDFTDYSEADVTRVEESIAKVAKAYGLRQSQAYVVHYWIRQTYGALAGLEGQESRGWLSPQAVIEAANELTHLADNGYLPTVGAEVPMMFLDDVRMILRANMHRSSNRFRLRKIVDTAAVRTAGKLRVKEEKLTLAVRDTFLDATAENWQSWLQVALGSVSLDDQNTFDPTFLTATDGALQSYRHPDAQLGALPVSIDTVRSVHLADKELNQVAVSLSGPRQRMLAAIKSTSDTKSRGLLSDLLEGKRTGFAYRGKLPAASQIAKRRARNRRWHEKDDVPLTLKQSAADLRQRGSELAADGTHTHAFLNWANNMVVGNATLNLGLWTGGMVERGFRSAFEATANVALGQGTELAELGQGDKAAGKDRYKQAVNTLANSPIFRAMANRETHFINPYNVGGFFTRTSAAYARAGIWLQDAVRNTRLAKEAKGYLSGVTRWVSMNPLHPENTMPLEVLVDQLTNNPLFLQNTGHPAHQAGVMAMTTLRGSQTSLLAKAIDGIIEPTTRSPSALTNYGGQLLLQIPLKFRRFMINTATLLTGTQAVQPLLATLFDGRKKGFIGSLQAQIAGENRGFEDEFFDLEEITEGIDLMKLYVQGGVSHSSLFAMGLLLGGLNLSGESDEEKRRRKLAKLMAVQKWYNPSELQNSFLNGTGIFLDNTPFAAWAADPNDPDGRALAQLPWQLNIFAAPLVGMEKFFRSGDTADLTNGFIQGIGSLPYTGDLSIKALVETGAALGLATAMQDDELSDEKIDSMTGLLVNTLGYYERRLLENTWVSMLYTHLDEVDRDPYMEIERDADKNLQGDARGWSLPSTGLQTYVDPETGEPGTGYLKRSEGKAKWAQLTENRFTLGAVSAIFDESLWRYNMPKKEREIELPKLSEEQQKSLILDTLSGLAKQGGGIQSVSEDEAENIVRNMTQAKTGKWLSDEQLDRDLVLTVMNDMGKEVLTKEGARGLFEGLASGAMQLDSPLMAGVYITKEMRSEIYQEWSAELIQEGVDLGLQQSQAESRAKRIMGGTYGDASSLGLSDLIFSKDIPDQDHLDYTQLNTSYVMGPNGYPMAVGFTRKALQVAGIPVVNRIYNSTDVKDKTDSVGNVTNTPAGLNTGLRGIVATPTNNPPTDQEMKKLFEEIANKTFTPSSSFDNGNGKSAGGYSRYRRGGGGGGGGGYTPNRYASFQRMYELPESRAPYTDDIPFINTNNPIIRRADVRRERVWSERGRLNQWQ